MSGGCLIETFPLPTYLVALYAVETWTLTQMDRRNVKCGYGEEWKSSGGWIKLLTRKFWDQ